MNYSDQRSLFMFMKINIIPVQTLQKRYSNVDLMFSKLPLYYIEGVEEPVESGSQKQLVLKHYHILVTFGTCPTSPKLEFFLNLNFQFGLFTITCKISNFLSEEGFRSFNYC